MAMSDAGTGAPGRRPVLSIITVTWNHREEIDSYLRPMQQAVAEAGFPIEVIIVDNDSADGTAEYIRQAAPWVRVIESGRNAGFAVGCNIGMAAARGRYLLLLNPDAFANATALRAMVAYLARHPRVGAVGCTLLHDDGRPQVSAYAELSPLSYLLNQSFFYPMLERLRKALLAVIPGDRTRPRRCGWLQGACVMVPRHVYTQVGGFDPAFFMYCEDTDWCRRIRDTGRTIVHLPAVAIGHRQKGTSRRAPEWSFRRVYRSVLLYSNKHHRGAERTLFRAAMLTDMLARVAVYTLLSFLMPGRRQFLRARVRSVLRMIAIIRAGDPDLYVDPPPGRSQSPA